MAVTFDNAVSAQGSSATSIESAAVTISGNWIGAQASGSAGTPQAATAIKVGGSGGTSLNLDAGNGTYGTFGHFSLGTLHTPPTGSQTIYASWSGTQDEIGILAVTYNDVDSGTPTGTVASATGTGTDSSATATVDASGTSGNIVVDFMATYHQAGDTCVITVGAGQTNRAEEESIGGGFTAIGASEETSTGATTTMSWSIAYGSGNPYAWTTRAFYLNAAAAGGVFIPIVGRGPGMALAGRGGLAG